MSKKNTNPPIKTWQIAIILAVIVFITFLLLNTTYYKSCLCCEVVSPIYRTYVSALIMAVVVFIFVGIIHHYTHPVKEMEKQKNCMSPFDIMKR